MNVRQQELLACTLAGPIHPPALFALARHSRMSSDRLRNQVQQLVIALAPLLTLQVMSMKTGLMVLFSYE